MFKKIASKITVRQLDNVLCIAGTVVLLCLALDVMKIMNGCKFAMQDIVLSAIIYICAVLSAILRISIYIEIKKKRKQRETEQENKIIEEPTIYIGKTIAKDIDLSEIEIKENAEEYQEDITNE
jgi:uncharacterized protein YgbK (DUF1537 family)